MADVVLVIHFAFAAFVVGTLPLVWLGACRGWSFVRNFWFRAAHLMAIGFVVAESLVGKVCPLTQWESHLRGTSSGAEASFIQHWLQRLLFYEADERVLTVVYVLFLVAVLFSFKLVGPRYPGWMKGLSGRKST
jgi:hypothetical protein